MPNSYTRPVSASDSTKVPLAGGTWTGPMVMSGAFAGPTNGFWIGNDSIYGANINVGGQGGAGRLAVCSGAGTARIALNEYYGLVFYTNGGGTSGSYNTIYQSSAGINLDAKIGSTIIARVAGTRVGGFPLQADDMPAKELFVAQVTTGQTISASLAQLTLQAATTNDGSFSVSSSNLTCLIAGWYLFDCRLIGSNATAAYLELDINGERTAPGASNPANNTFVYTCPIKLLVGDVVKLKAKCLGTSLTIDTATYAFLRNLTVLRIN